MKCLDMIRRGLFAAAALVFASSQMGVGAWAADTSDDPSDDNPYTFTVTLNGGNAGTLNTGMASSIVDLRGASSTANLSVKGDSIVISGLQYGDRINLDAQVDGAVNLSADSIYYVMGVRESGRDNRGDDNADSYTGAEGAGNASFTVTKDSDYVVAYGYKGDMVAYTVSYVDASGNALAASRTYYGSVGDKPVVAFLYVENYQPQAYNLTRTLTSNAASNTFEFVYTQINRGTTSGGTDNTGTDGNAGTGGNDANGVNNNDGAAGGTNTNGNGANGANDNNGTAGGDTDTNGGNGNAANDGSTTDDGTSTDDGSTAGDGTSTDDGTATDGADSSEETEPQEIIDLDDGDVPLADNDLPDSTRGGSRTNLPIIIGICIGGVAVIALIILGAVLITKRNRKN